MHRYSLLVWVNRDITARTVVWANNGYEAKLLGEAQYGVGNVIDWTIADD